MPLSAIWISIHALRVEGDLLRSLPQSTRMAISIHALRVEGDIRLNSKAHANWHFYPRPPGGGRQPTGLRCKHVTGISIHALRVEGDFLLCHAQRLYEISIHALRVEGDVFLFALVLFILRFLSTPSGWRATANAYPYLSYFNISIHALRVESDRRSARFPNRSGHFYPRPPGGGRRRYRRCQ